MRVYLNSSSTTFQSIGISVHLALPTWVPCRRQDPTTVLSVKQVEHCSAGIHLLISNLVISRFPWEMEGLFANALFSAWRSSNSHLQRALSTPKYILFCSKEFSSSFLWGCKTGLLEIQIHCLRDSNCLEHLSEGEQTWILGILSSTV